MISRPFLALVGGVVFVLFVIAVFAVTAEAVEPDDPRHEPPPDVQVADLEADVADVAAYVAGEAAARSAEYAALAYVASLPTPRQPESTSDSRTYTAGATGNVGGHLASIRQCESGGDYGAVSPGGQYRGAYQFDYQTWAGVGGSGDPAAASPAEQDLRASILYEQRGAQPWPVCGR